MNEPDPLRNSRELLEELEEIKIQIVEGANPPVQPVAEPAVNEHRVAWVHIPSSALEDSCEEFDIDLTDLPVDEQVDGNETLLPWLSNPAFFQTSQLPARSVLPHRIEFDLTDPAVHQLNIRAVDFPKK